MTWNSERVRRSKRPDNPVNQKTPVTRLIVSMTSGSPGMFRLESHECQFHTHLLSLLNLQSISGMCQSEMKTKELLEIRDVCNVTLYILHYFTFPSGTSHRRLSVRIFKVPSLHICNISSTCFLGFAAGSRHLSALRFRFIGAPNHISTILYINLY